MRYLAHVFTGVLLFFCGVGVVLLLSLEDYEDVITSLEVDAAYRADGFRGVSLAVALGDGGPLRVAALAPHVAPAGGCQRGGPPRRLLFPAGCLPRTATAA